MALPANNLPRRALRRALRESTRTLTARWNLYLLGDSRALAPRLGPTLTTAASTWPDLLPKNWRPRSLIDVGGHDGWITAQLAELYHLSVVALVEPLPWKAAALRDQTFAPRQFVHECALGPEPGTARLNVLANQGSSSLLPVSSRAASAFGLPMDTERVLDVPVRRLDDVFADTQLQTLDLLKLDVQGYELEVLRGGAHTLQRTLLLVTEVSFFDHYDQQPRFIDVYTFLRAHGYELHGTFGFTYDARMSPLQCDAVFINTSLLATE